MSIQIVSSFHNEHEENITSKGGIKDESKFCKIFSFNIIIDAMILLHFSFIQSNSQCDYWLS